MKTIILDKPMWIIGDVHGEYDLLVDLLNQIPEGAPICFVGDLIDRGSNSKEVIQLIREKGYYCVKGNHEDMAVNHLYTLLDKEPQRYNLADWIKYGGDATIYSYIKEKDFETYYKKTDEIENDFNWLKNLPTIIKFKIKTGSFFPRYLKPVYASHSSIQLFRSDEKIDKENEDSYVMWNRVRQKEVGFAVNIHGHSPIMTELSNISKSQINVDSGVVYSGNPMFGYLTAIEYPTKRRLYSKTKK